MLWLFHTPLRRRNNAWLTTATTRGSQPFSPSLNSTVTDRRQQRVATILRWQGKTIPDRRREVVILYLKLNLSRRSIKSKCTKEKLYKSQTEVKSVSLSIYIKKKSLLELHWHNFTRICSQFKLILNQSATTFSEMSKNNLNRICDGVRSRAASVHLCTTYTFRLSAKLCLAPFLCCMTVVVLPFFLYLLLYLL